MFNLRSQNRAYLKSGCRKSQSPSVHASANGPESSGVNPESSPILKKNVYPGLHNTLSVPSYEPSRLYIFSPSTFPPASRVNMNESFDSGVTKNVSFPS